MKLFTILKKNFRLLLRSKSSAFVVFVGPLLIIALILITFSFSPDVSLSVGVFNAAQDGLSQNFVGSLENSDYTVITYLSLDQCINDVKVGTVNLCLRFPDNFNQDSSGEQVVEFFIDQSRINIVESIIFAISTNIDTTSEEITLSKTKNVLTSISESADIIIEENEAALEGVDGGIKSGTATISASSDRISNSVEDVDIDASAMNDYIAELQEKTEDLEVATQDLIDAADSASCCASQLADIEDIFDDNNDLIGTNLLELEEAVGELDQASAAIGVSSSESEIIQQKVSAVNTLISEVKGSLGKIGEEAEAIKGLSAADIENHFEIKVNEVVANSNKSLFIFPYYLMLLVLFVGMMLSSNLVVMEKESLAYFRNFSSPTTEATHTLARYLSNFIILAVQLTAVLLAVFYFIKIPILNNVWISIVVLFLSITLFIFLGYLLGYIFRTQEGITIGFISLGGLFAFLSNLILPVESFPLFAQKALLFNPYMLSSEMLKQSILFGSGFGVMKAEFLLLLAYTFVAVVLGFTLQRFSFEHFTFDWKKRNAMLRPHISKDKNFHLENDDVLKNLEDLHKALERMEDEEMSHYVTTKSNEFALWVVDAFKERRLARMLRKAGTRSAMIDALSYHLAEKKDNITPLGQRKWLRITLWILAGVVTLALIFLVVFLLFF